MKPRVLLVDNYDSFTYNLVQRFGEQGAGVEVFRNDEITLKGIERRRPTHLVISPGPCTPKEGGISNAAIRRFAGKIPILGVCLGHQCIGFSFGAKVVRAPRLMHGKTSRIRHDGLGIYAGVENPFVATRYHSLAVDVSTLPATLVPVAWSEKNELMGIRHREFPLEGVQFHPESFLTEAGPAILANFLRQKA